ncbi:MAG: hypothetical protein QOG10_6625 [Kribbellaceae bacterium]|nr:hypothetical protein [Kribbellaceae bacterium]
MAPKPERTQFGKSGKQRAHAGEDRFPIGVGSGADRDCRQAGPNETVSAASMPRPQVTFGDEADRLRVAAAGRGWADSDGRQQLWPRPGSEPRMGSPVRLRRVPIMKT